MTKGSPKEKEEKRQQEECEPREEEEYDEEEEKEEEENSVPKQDPSSLPRKGKPQREEEEPTHLPRLTAQHKELSHQSSHTQNRHLTGQMKNWKPFHLGAM